MLVVCSHAILGRGVVLKKTLRFLTRESRLQNYGDSGEIKYNGKSVFFGKYL